MTQHAETLKSMLQDIINGKEESAAATMHDYFVAKSREVAGFAQPSAPNAYPDVIQEALNTKKVVTLAEAMVHDKKAQAYFKKEMMAFIESLKIGK